MVDVAKLTTGVVLVIVAIIVIFQLVGNTATDITNAANNISSSGLPLAGLFASDGVVPLIYMVGILLAIVGVTFGLAAIKHK